jgi:hypothetical protein
MLQTHSTLYAHVMLSHLHTNEHIPYQITHMYTYIYIIQTYIYIYIYITCISKPRCGRDIHQKMAPSTSHSDAASRRVATGSTHLACFQSIRKQLLVHRCLGALAKVAWAEAALTLQYALHTHAQLSAFTRVGACLRISAFPNCMRAHDSIAASGLRKSLEQRQGILRTKSWQVRHVQSS